jgi:3-(3-hydroxy-phenyl)propionate hydroxylase
MAAVSRLHARVADVAIVGFGPVGAILAGLLGSRGLGVVVLEREAGLYPLPRAAHIDHTGLRTLQELGCLDELLPTMITNPGTDCVTADRRILFSIPGGRRSASELPMSMYFHQPTFDSALRRTAERIPNVDVRLEREVVALEQVEHGVRILAAAADGGEELVEATWVVGCDGASSSVRALAGIEQDDFGFEEQWLVFDLRLRDSALRLPQKAVQVCDPVRPRTELPMPGDRYRFEFMLMPGEDAAELLQPGTAFDRLFAGLVPPGSAEIERTATYTFRGAVADRWRSGRVFVAGDAAHLLPPFLGQGMCSGIRDAANLAWKLHLVHRCGAADALLDTYGLERRPHVSTVIEAAVALGRIVCTVDPDEARRRDERLLAASAADGPPYRFALPPLRPGPLVLEGGGMQFPQGAPDASGRRLDDVIGRRFLVVTPDGADRPAAGRWWRDVLGAAELPARELSSSDGVIGRWLERRAGSFVVVRPDRYVLAVSNDLDAVTEAVRPLLHAP